MEILASFSQDDEDVILYHVLKNEGKIFWIDVGANDCEYLSITKLFYDKGNCGINIEPQKKYIFQYKEERTRDITLAIGLSDKEGKLKLHGTGTGATFDSVDGEHQIAEEVDVLTLQAVCKQYVKQEKIHFLKVDVEGFEKKVLLGADFKLYRPVIIVMESAISNTTISNYEEWEYILFESEYIFAYQCGINRYYLAKERTDLLQRFDDIKHINNIYTVYHINKYLEQIVRMQEEVLAYRRTISDIYQTSTFKIMQYVQKIFNFFKKSK